jgi:hypothetical protein
MNAELAGGLFLWEAEVQTPLQDMVADVVKSRWIARNGPSRGEPPS